MIILDTNVVSETIRPRPSTSVIGWIDAQSAHQLYLCTPVLAELRYGMERLETGLRKQALCRTIERFEGDVFKNRILTFDEPAARAYAKVALLYEQSRREIQRMDGFIAAIAMSHGAAVATRNVRDFENLGIEIINPFEFTIST